MILGKLSRYFNFTTIIIIINYENKNNQNVSKELIQCVYEDFLPKKGNTNPKKLSWESKKCPGR